MPVSIQTLVQLDTAYISKHNANYAAIKAAVDALQTQIGQSSGSVLSANNFSTAMFGPVNSLINESSYVPTANGTNLDVTAGYFWHHATGTVRRKLVASVIAFAGDAALTYFVVIDSAGEPTKSTSSTDAAYSVVWTGSAFGAITRLAAVSWAHATFDGSKIIANLGNTTYQSLDPLLEAIAGAAASGVPITVTSADVTLTTAQAMENFAIIVSGAKTANRNLIVPNFEKPYLIINNTTGAFTLTVKTVAGTGPALANNAKAMVFCDATNVILASTSVAATLFTELLDAPSSYTGHALKDVRVNAGATGLEFYLPPYDVGAFLEAAPGANQILLRHVVSRQVIFAAGLAPSQGNAGTAATAQTDLDVQKNGASVGTIRWAAAGTVATFIMASQTTFAVGDRLTVVAQATPDATLAKITFTLSGTR